MLQTQVEGLSDLLLHERLESAGLGAGDGMTGDPENLIADPDPGAGRGRA
jgi:hypothetical protein